MRHTTWCHTMILLLLLFLLQPKLHIHTLPISHPASNLAYLFRTLNLTHHLLNTSNLTLASNCWICLSISLPGGLAITISTDQWTQANTSFYHTYRGEYLFIIHMLFIFNWSSSQSQQDTDLPPYRSHFYSQRTSYRRTHHLWRSSTITDSFLFFQTKLHN